MTKKYTLEIDDGSIDIEINGDPNRIFKFKPRDLNIFDNFLQLEPWMQNELPKIVDMWEEDELGNSDIDFDKLKESERVLNEKFDSIFGHDSHVVAFNGTHPATPTSEGCLFVTFIYGLMPILESAWKDSGLIGELEANKKKYLKEAHFQKKAMHANKRAGK